MKYSIVTFGCRVNQADSFVIEEELRRRGAIDASPEDADLVIVNSCSVTASADQGTRQTIRRIVRSNPDVRVVVTGCYATRRPDEILALPNVVRVVPNDGTLHHVVYTKNGAGATHAIYVDGVPQVLTANGAVTYANPTNALWITSKGSWRR